MNNVRENLIQIVRDGEHARMADMLITFLKGYDDHKLEVELKIADLERELEDQRDRFEERFEGLHYHVEERCDDIQEMVAQANSD